MDYAPQKLLPLLMVGILVSSSTTYSMNFKKEHLWCAGVILSGLAVGYAIKCWRGSYRNTSNGASPHLFPARYVKHNDVCQYIINETTGDTYTINAEKPVVKATTFKNQYTNYWDIPCNQEQRSFIRINETTNKSTFYEGSDIRRPTINNDGQDLSRPYKDE
jgi:hypothetical protein